MRTKEVIKYFEGLAEKHLGHTPKESHFYRSHQLAQASPYLCLDYIDFTLKGTVDSASKSTKVTFLLLSHLDEAENDELIDSLFDQTEEKLTELFTTMFEDCRQRNAPAFGLDVSSINARPVSMENDMDYGWEVSLTFTHKLYL
jgi:hypothetical protein